LDAVRAVLSSQQTGILTDAQVALWGYSGGSLASGWAAQLQPTYAPDLQLAGVALGGTVPDILSVMNTVNKGPFAGLVPAGMIGLSREYPELGALVNASLVPSKFDEFYAAASQCDHEGLHDFAFQDMYTYVNDSSVFTSPIAQNVLATNIMGAAPPKAPLFIYKSILDEVSPVADTDTLVAGYCASGTSVQYLRDLASEHVVLAVTGAPDAILWLDDRLNGKAVSSGCSKSNVITSLIDPDASSMFGKELLQDLLDLIGQPIGSENVA
jgi:hypothetical protein